MERMPVEHEVSVRIKDGDITLANHKDCLCLYAGDSIRWVFHGRFPWFVIVKALVSPLDIRSKISHDGQEIKAAVRKNAAPGVYSYAIGAYDGKGLIIKDPDIIIRPPK